MDARPAGKGGLPAPRFGEGGGSPPRKNDQNRGEVAGQNKVTTRWEGPQSLS